MTELADQVNLIGTQLNRGSEGNTPENTLPRASYQPKGQGVSNDNQDSEGNGKCTFSVNP